MIDDVLTEKEKNLLYGAIAPKPTLALLVYMFAKIKKLEKQIADMRGEE